MPISCVLFRVDAGPHIGVGHLQRCLSLATAMRDLGTVPVFLTNNEPLARDRVRRFGFEAYMVDSSESWGRKDLEKAIAIAHSNECTGVVVDSDYEGEDYLRQLRESGLFVCAIEDIAPHPFPCQLVVNGDAHAHQLSYKACCADTRFLLGPEYSILRREFWNVPARVTNDVVENVLVTLGGSDPYDYMPGLLHFLSDLPGAFKVSAIIGPFFRNMRKMEDVARHSVRLINLIHSPDSVCNLMLQADMAISAGGQTLYELACVGCPTVAIRTAANQDGQLHVLNEAGVVRAVWPAAGCSIGASIGDAVLSLVEDHSGRASMSAAGQRLIDGRGAIRVVEAMLS